MSGPIPAPGHVPARGTRGPVRSRRGPRGGIHRQL